MNNVQHQHGVDQQAVEHSHGRECYRPHHRQAGPSTNTSAWKPAASRPQCLTAIWRTAWTMAGEPQA